MLKELKRECYECGGIMIRDVRRATHTYKKQIMTFDQPGWYCQNCHEVVLEGVDLTISEEAYDRLKNSIDNFLTPAEIQDIRKNTLKISQREAGRILGGGERSFQRYESGKIMLSQSMNNLLIILRKHPKLLNEIRQPRS